MTEFRSEDTTGSLDTNIRLLAQRVGSTERDLGRLGDTVRHNTRELQSIQAEVKAADTLLDHRLISIEENLKENRGSIRTIFLGLVGTVIAIVLEFLIKR